MQRWFLAAASGTALAVALFQSPGTSATIPPTPAAAQTSAAASDIVARMAAAREGLDSYSVPIHFSLTVHKGPSVSAKLDSTRYFERPDREVLVMKSMPSIARKFRYIYAGLGTPETWPAQYDISRVESTSPKTYSLKGVPKANSDVSYVLMDVDTDTLAPTTARWFYKNGGTISMQFQNAAVSGKYWLPQTETIDIDFPEYKVHAVGTFGTYSINQPIPSAIWQTSPQPLPT